MNNGIAAINGTEEAVDLRLTMTVTLEPGEGLRQAVVGALARGYCTARNTGKVIDNDLIEAMADEIGDLFGFASEEAVS